MQPLGVYLARNLADDPASVRQGKGGKGGRDGKSTRSSKGYNTADGGAVAGFCGTLCAPSIVKNVAQQILHCACGLRRVELTSAHGGTATIHGRWISRGHLDAYLEECEAESASIAFPELAVKQAWG